MTASTRLISDVGRGILGNGCTSNGKGAQAGREGDERARENSLQ